MWKGLEVWEKSNSSLALAVMRAMDIRTYLEEIEVYLTVDEVFNSMCVLLETDHDIGNAVTELEDLVYRKFAETFSATRTSFRGQSPTVKIE